MQALLALSNFCWLTSCLQAGQCFRARALLELSRKAAQLGVLARLSFEHFQTPLWKRWCGGAPLLSLSAECLDDRLQMLFSRGPWYYRDENDALGSCWSRMVQCDASRQLLGSKENTNLLASVFMLAICARL